MNQHPSRRVEPSTLTADDAGFEAAFDALSDADCRAILTTADEPMTTREIADACDIALSTAYRKVERLSETPLLTEGIRFDRNGDHAAEYTRGTSELCLSFTDAGVTLTVETTETETETETDTPSARFGAVGISAD